MKEYQRKVFALDQFKKARLSERGIYICKEQTLQKPGSHWFLIITELDKVYFLDSFAQSPKHFGIERKINKLKKPVAALSNSIQNPFSNIMWRILFIFCLPFI